MRETSAAVKNTEGAISYNEWYLCHRPRPGLTPADIETSAGGGNVVFIGMNSTVGTQSETWDNDEPSERGIDGIERMRLVRGDIAARVTDLAARLNTAKGSP